MVTNCIIFTNGMVMAFDENGNQVAECQGFILNVAEKLKSHCNENTKWEFAEWKKWSMPANFNWWWKNKNLKEKKKSKEMVYAVVNLEWYGNNFCIPDVELFESEKEAKERAKKLNCDVLKLKIKKGGNK